MDVQFVENFILSYIALNVCQKAVGHYYVGLFLGSLFSFIDLFGYHRQIPHCSDNYSFTVGLNII